MVNVTIAGGSGQVAREVIDALLAAREHEITVLSRQVAPEDAPQELRWRVVDYNDQKDLIEALRGCHTLLSFLQLLSDPESKTQKRLIDAAVVAGVKRFAPSEYGSAEITDMPWWTGKESTRQYLKTINEKQKVFEYILFQPGLFLDYLAFPYKTARYVDPLQTIFDYQNCRAIMVEGYEDAVMTLTSVADVASIIAQTVNSQAAWPEIGGIRGNKVTVSQVIALGERVRDHRFAVDKVKLKDLEAGTLRTSWALEKRHRAVDEQQYADLVKKVTIGTLLSSAKGAWDVSDELNQLAPDHEFDEIESFLTRVWGGKA